MWKNPPKGNVSFIEIRLFNNTKVSGFMCIVCIKFEDNNMLHCFQSLVCGGVVCGKIPQRGKRLSVQKLHTFYANIVHVLSTEVLVCTQMTVGSIK